ncbi:hypothetical protein [Burkholderia sp. BDU5]|uniref:hypothetical protein n=1 Tax=Burkholderia sp. BDU5 TaxID=1385590 RepID=UPI0018D215F3|nr:hypothetical protein [Burkholderia sp. BDU5]
MAAASTRDEVAHGPREQARDEERGYDDGKPRVYEVTEQADNNSALQFAPSLLGERVGALGLVGANSIGDDSNVIRLHAGGFEAAIAALNSDSRFKVVASPNLRVRPGQVARLNVGQSVPVVGTVSYPSATARTGTECAVSG